MLTTLKVLVAATVVVPALGVLPGQPATSMTAAPTITIKYDYGTRLGLPLWLRNRPDFDRGVTGDVVVSAPVSNLRIELLNDDGLNFNKNPLIDQAATLPKTRFGYSVGSTTPGLHQVTVKITSDQTGTTTIPGPLFYVPGDDTIPATGDLTGLAYGWTDEYEYDRGEAEGSEDTLLTFIDGDTAYLGAPKRGLPRCRRVDPAAINGCIPYRYDAATGYVEIGGDIAKLVGDRLWVSGIGLAYDEGTYVNEKYLTEHVAYPSRKNFGGKWTGGERSDADRRYTLALKLSGKFVLTASRYTPDGRVQITQRGTYRLTSPGKMVLRSASGKRTVRTFAVATTATGKLAPGQAVWMVFRNHDSRGDVYYDEVRLRRTKPA